MTTHVEDTLDNFPRDMQWGQGVQLLEDYTKIESATPTFVIKAYGLRGALRFYIGIGLFWYQD